MKGEKFQNINNRNHSLKKNVIFFKVLISLLVGEKFDFF